MTDKNWKVLGELPVGYEYKVMKQDDIYKIIGINFDKAPIGFVLHEDKLTKIFTENKR